MLCYQYEDFTEAETCALKSLELARAIESPLPIGDTYNLLGDIYCKQEQIHQAIETKIQAWRYAHQLSGEGRLYSIYRDLAKIRIYQAQQGNPHRYVPKARQWLQWALPLAMRLDRQVGNYT